MTAQQLKNSILQMAVQGKLVPQNPDDEPASVLLERIKAEKEELIKAGKIKKDKKSSEIFRGTSRNLPYAYCEQIGKEIRDISDEIPFEIPESWEWIRLTDIVIKEIKRGKSPVYADYGSVLVFAQKCNVKTGGINISLSKYLADSAVGKYPQEEYMQNNDIIVNSTGTGTLGRIGFYTDSDNPNNIPLVPDSHVTIVRVNSELSDYIYNILKWYQPVLEESGEGSTKQKELKADRIKELFIPLPPLYEQQRIVAKIEELLPYIEAYEQAETQLTALNTSFPDMLKKSILQYAVQGKLVPQDADDEPASVLLERIRAEKQELIKQGKIKKEKPLSPISDDEIPFEIPESWCWVRMFDIIDVRDGTHDTPKYVAQGIPLVTSKNLCNGKIDFSTAKLISYEDHEKISQRSKVDNGDIMFAMIGSIGNPVLYYGNDTFSIKNMALFKQIPNGIFMKYLYWYLFEEQTEMKKYASGGVQSFVSLSYLRNYTIPLPPLSEQKRIVEKIEELMPIIDGINK